MLKEILLTSFVYTIFIVLLLIFFIPFSEEGLMYFSAGVFAVLTVVQIFMHKISHSNKEVFSW